MGSPTFPVSRIHQVAAASCLIWSLVSLAVHLLSQALWAGYSKSLRPTERRQWCNKIACGLHAAILACNQAASLFDPVLNADPLHGVTDAHFFWGSVLLGYLVYDTAYSLLFFKISSGAVMLAHHVVGIAGCVIGVYYNKLALFGMAIEVFFEACNPLLHVLGCMRIAGKTSGRTYSICSDLFLIQFFIFRVAIANLYFAKLLRIVLSLHQQPWWAWAGVAIFGLLNLLNAFWLFKLMRMAGSTRRSTNRSRAVASVPSAGKMEGTLLLKGSLATRRHVVSLTAKGTDGTAAVQIGSPASLDAGSAGVATAASNKVD